MNKITNEIFLKDLLELTSEIKKRPEIYLGEKSLTKFYHFISGFSEAYHYMDSEKNILLYILDFRNGSKISTIY